MDIRYNYKAVTEYLCTTVLSNIRILTKCLDSFSRNMITEPNFKSHPERVPLAADQIVSVPLTIF